MTDTVRWGPGRASSPCGRQTWGKDSQNSSAGGRRRALGPRQQAEAGEAGMSWSIGEWGTRRGQLERAGGPGQASPLGVGTLLGKQLEWPEQSWRSSGPGPCGFSGFLQGRRERVGKEQASPSAAAVPPGAGGHGLSRGTCSPLRNRSLPGPPPKPSKFRATALLGAVCNPCRLECCRGPEGPHWGSWEVWSYWEHLGQGGVPCRAEGKAPFSFRLCPVVQEVWRLSPSSLMDTSPPGALRGWQWPSWA